MYLLRRVTYTILALLAFIPVLAQQQSQDSLVVLMSSKSAQMVDIKGASYRKVVGPARFLHNNTYLLCDTALWNVETKVIEAWGNVSILQDETVLTSDDLTYYIDEDLAKFRGSVVQLTDKDHNTLRTRHLDYNTKDSVAVFMNGGAMRDKDGQIIESRTGTYDSKVKKFTFENNVNMFTDSIFVKTRKLIYESDYNLATFDGSTDAWQEENMLSSGGGWYDRGRELFFFADDVHLMSQDQEGWCDSLFFRRLTSDVEMLGNAQVTDTTRNVFGLAGRIEYVDTLSKVTMTRKPAVITQTEEQDGSLDTLYLGAGKLVYYTVKMCDVDSLFKVESKKRLEALDVDPVGEYRKKAAEAAAKAAEEAAMNDPNQRARIEAEQRAAAEKAAEEEAAARAAREAVPELPQLESFAVPDSSALSSADSLALPSVDSLSIPAVDSLAVVDSVVMLPPKDTTKIGFLEALRNVRIYKKNMQVVCDSLVYSDLDSLARMFIEPIVWQDGTRQYSADSITVVVDKGSLDKASLMSNAFITIQQDTSHYNQIKGTEMLAFFDDKGGLERFDALGGASALFYIEENETLATVNKTDSKMLSATFKNGDIQRIYYYEQPKNDGYPLVQLKRDERQLKGFNWQPEKRPADRNAVTPLSLRPSQRKMYSSRPKARFTQTDIYFPGYMDDVYRQIQVRDSLRQIRQREEAMKERMQAQADSLVLSDSLSVPDTLDVAPLDSLLAAPVDTLATAAVADSLSVADSTTVSKVMTPEELKAAAKAEKERQKAAKKAEREARRKARIEKKEARWAELDRKDAEKARIKEEKRLAKERKRKRKTLEGAARQAEKDAKLLEEYIRKYESQNSRENSGK